MTPIRFRYGPGTSGGSTDSPMLVECAITRTPLFSAAGPFPACCSSLLRLRVFVRCGEGCLVLGLEVLARRVVAPQRLACVDLRADVRLELLLLQTLLGDLRRQMSRDHQD